MPQGSILSVTLFSVKIDSITQCLKPGVDCSLYVDDFQICYRSSNVSIIEHQLQLCLSILQQWAKDNDFSDILEIPLFFILPPWCVKPPKIVLDLVHLKKDQTDASIYQQFETSTMIAFLYIWEFCGMCYSLSIGHRIIHEITRFGNYFHC